MNVLDLAVLVLVALCAFAGYRRGLIRTVYRLASFFIAMFLANYLHGPVARMLRGTALFTTIQESISSTLNLERVVVDHTAARQSEVIDSLPVPDSLREMLHNFNTPDMFELLQVSTIDDYISGFFANMVINIVAMVAVFFLVLIMLSIAGVALDIVSKLPVINSFNNGGGLIVGLALGGILAWICIVVMTLIFATTTDPLIYALMNGSFVVQFVLEFMMPQVTSVA
ncbi:MAG: CvpA family protein [Defluviitaleaceae bacterium]|nr:CvpA family protein [Defluviitaleaceae bacterium]